MKPFDTRHHFELFVCRYSNLPLERDFEGFYVSIDVEIMWDTYQAAVSDVLQHVKEQE